MAYADALRRFEAWLTGRPADDAMLTAYLDELFDRGLAPESGVLVVAAVARAALECARAGRECSDDPVGPMTRERLERFHREGAGRGPGQVRGLTWDEVELMCRFAEGDGLRGKRDAAILGVAADEAAHGISVCSRVAHYATPPSSVAHPARAGARPSGTFAALGRGRVLRTR